MQLIVIIGLFAAITFAAKMRQHHQIRQGLEAGQKILLDSLKK
jgi:hypothetical protein